MTEAKGNEKYENRMIKVFNLLNYSPNQDGRLNNFNYIIEEIIFLILNIKDYEKGRDFFQIVKNEIKNWPKISSKKDFNSFFRIIRENLNKTDSKIHILEKIFQYIINYKNKNGLGDDITLSFLYQYNMNNVKTFLSNLPTFGLQKVRTIMSYYFKTNDIIIDEDIITILNRLGLLTPNIKKISEIRLYVKKNYPQIFNYKNFYNLKIHCKKICDNLNPLCNKCQIIELCKYKKKNETLWIFEKLKENDLIVIDLFSGAGGMVQGFVQAGFIPILAIDFFKSACKTLKFNHPKTYVICKDIRNVSEKYLENLLNGKKPTVIIGGPPCQGFSIAGKQDPNDPRNSLFMEFIRILKFFKAPFFVMENVPGILSSKNAKGEPIIDIIVNEFRKIGYRVLEPKILNAADYGVPQSRKRVIIVGTNTKNKIIFPPFPTHAENPKNQLFPLKKWVPVKSVLFKKEEVNPKYMHSLKMIEGFQKRKKRNMNKGKGYGWQILNLNKPSYTISARYWKDGSDALVKYNDKEIRMLTERECARIQTFPDNYIFFGSRAEIYSQIGNAVPCLLAQRIAECIKKSIKNNK
ncbi:MAG: DNA (cytosine-5-)-methyltransferase [Promethearchaeota archaeon]